MIEMYYETRGEGSPLVLLHGGLTTIEGSFGRLIPFLERDFRLIAVEQQGHGRTPDVDRPMSFTQMADDTAELLRRIGVEKADYFGYSDGGNVALGLAIRHPSLVRRMAIAGTNFNNEGLYPQILEMLKAGADSDESLGADEGEDPLAELREAYERVAPRTEDWPLHVRKVSRLAADFPGWDPEALRRIQAPTLVIAADDDIICPEHAVEMYRLIPNARLAVLPRTEHHTIVERTEWLPSMLIDFFRT